MKRISKDHAKRFEALQSDYEAAFNEAQTAISHYNGILSDLESLRDDIASSIEEYTEGRSEAWQESDKAEPYAEWLSAWQDLDCSEASEPDELDLLSLPTALD